MKTFLIMTMFSLSLPAMATSYIPTPIERKVKEADAIIEGVFIDSEYGQLNDGSVVTVNYFEVSQQSGLSFEEQQAGELQVLVLGGEIGDTNVKVEGAPIFQKGDRRLLFINKGDQGSWLAGLKSGEFTVKMIGNSKLYTSTIFPLHPRAGQILEKDLKKLVYQEKGTRFGKIVDNQNDNKSRKVASQQPITIHTHKSERNSLRRLKRSIASNDPLMVEESSDKSLSILWPIIFLISLGFVSKLISKKRIQ